MLQTLDTAPPPRPDVQPEAGPDWPLWSPLAVIGLGLAVGLALTALLVGVLEASGVDLDEGDPRFNALATLILDVSFVAATLAVLAAIARPRAWHFGVRRGVPLRSAIVLAFMAVLAFFVFAVAYGVLFHPENPQTIAEDLGADQGTAMLIVGALLVIVVAPVAEEIFFRGFLFRVLRLRMPFVLAAGIDGVLFGLVHGSLVILPVLAFLGFILCWSYERSGTLFVPIALHALNNALAWGTTTNEALPSLAVGAAMIAACVLVPAVLPRRTPPPLLSSGSA